MFLFLILINEKLINGSFYNYTREESPKTINITKGQGLMMVDYDIGTFVISIPGVFSSPRYVTSTCYFFSFVDDATITMHFLSNTSFYIANNWRDFYTISSDCDFLFKNFNYKCEDGITKRYGKLTTDFIKRRDKNIAVLPDMYGRYEEEEIEHFTSQPPYTLKIKASNDLISNATIEVDYGYGKRAISTYHITSQIFPFKAKFYITYNTCDSFLFDNIQLDNPNNKTVVLTMENIPRACYSYSASVLVSLDFPSDSKLFYKLKDEVISPLRIKRGIYHHISRNFPFTLTFYVQKSRCIDYYLIKTISIDNHLTPRKVNIFASDIPDICEEE